MGRIAGGWRLERVRDAHDDARRTQGRHGESRRFGGGRREGVLRARAERQDERRGRAARCARAPRGDALRRFRLLVRDGFEACRADASDAAEARRHAGRRLSGPGRQTAVRHDPERGEGGRARFRRVPRAAAAQRDRGAEDQLRDALRAVGLEHLERRVPEGHRYRLLRDARRPSRGGVRDRPRDHGGDARDHPQRAREPRRRAGRGGFARRADRRGRPDAARRGARGRRHEHDGRDARHAGPPAVDDRRHPPGGRIDRGGEPRDRVGQSRSVAAHRAAGRVARRDGGEHGGADRDRQAERRERAAGERAREQRVRDRAEGQRCREPRDRHDGRDQRQFAGSPTSSA